YLKHPRRDLMYIALAGPISNVILAIGFGTLLRVIDPASHDFSGRVEVALVRMVAWSVVLNLSLAAFNMIPIFPLDGSKVLAGRRGDETAADPERDEADREAAPRELSRRSSELGRASGDFREPAHGGGLARPDDRLRAHGSARAQHDRDGHRLARRRNRPGTEPGLHPVPREGARRASSPLFDARHDQPAGAQP